MTVARQGRRVAIVGVGYSDVGRNTGLSERHHAAQAAVRALDDAGLTAKDIDGASTWGGDAVDFALDARVRRLQWSLNVSVSPAFITPAYHAAQAVAQGHAETVMAFRIMMQQPPSVGARRGRRRCSASRAWPTPSSGSRTATSRPPSGPGC